MGNILLTDPTHTLRFLNPFLGYSLLRVAAIDL